MSTLSRLVLLAFCGAAIGACFRQAKFASEDRAAMQLSDELTRLGPRCDQWFVRECDTDGVKAVWFFRPRIDGPAEAAAYDGTSGELLYQRQFGASGGMSFTPVRQYGAAPKCRPSLDSSAAERACTWIEKQKAPAASPEPSPSQTP